MVKNNIVYDRNCFIDKDYEFAGIYEIDSRTYIDFDRRTIYQDSRDQKISSRKMAVLEKLLLESPSAVDYDSLQKAYYSEDYYRKDPDIQTLRNVVSSLNRFIEITNVSKFGYKIELSRSIRKFGGIRKSEVTDIAGLFDIYDSGASDEDYEEILKANEITLGFSSKFFHSGAQELACKNGNEIMPELEKLSGIFNEITTLDGTGNRANVILDAYNLIVDGCKDKHVREILKIKGPLGSYKNRIMQYLYLAISKNNSEILPFYIDIAYYEKMAENNSDITDDDIIRAFLADFEEIKSIKEKCLTKTPLLMIDGVRDFSKGDEVLYYFISKKIKEIKCKLVVCMDGDFTVNNQHMFNVHPLAPHNYRNYMRITSMNLYKKAESIEFIKNCLDISDVYVSDELPPEKIYESLVKLGFLSLDAYWLVYIVKYYQGNLLNNKGNISDLYSAICMSCLESGSKISSAAELAYKFEFDSVDFYKTDPFLDERWQLIRKHRSVLNFLIAKHYVRKISELDFSKPHGEVVRSLDFFNMVLQKSITRFVVDMLCGNEDYEYKIMLIAEDYYDDLSLFGKSELTFWMARLHNFARKKRCSELLKEYSEKEIAHYNQTDFKSFSEKKNTAFLIRGISVSQIYEKDAKAFKYYINSLISDKTANAVNRGFHLEYYGDKPYIPNKTLLDFEDDVTKGENTLNVLCLSLEKRMKKKDNTNPVAVLEVMTLCNLIQARIECTENEAVFDVRPYMSRCIRYLEWIAGHKSLKGFSEAAQYFMWMHNEYEKQLELFPSGRICYSFASPINKFSNANKVERTGWVKADIPAPENIVEHMYDCWLIGMLYLPESYEDTEYDKNRILQMLLLHDLGETETGDICRPEKARNQKLYDYREDNVMQSLLLSGTYPGAVDIGKYLVCWNEWSSKSGINYAVAKDIDNIQTIYKFCKYYISYPEKFDAEKIVYWLTGVNEIETEIGKHIARELIRINPEFAHIIEQAGDIFND